MDPIKLTQAPAGQTIPWPIQHQQDSQSAQTQAGAQQTGADILTGMTQQRLQKLYQQQDALNNEISKTTEAASTPVPVTGTGAINPPGQHQWQNIPNDERPTYSASGSKKQGIANAVRGVANLVGAFETKHVNDKNKALSIDIERILESNQGIETAKQALQQDPNNKDAQAAIEKNNGIINALLSDPKKRKSIGKAFEINFTDPSQNDKPEHAAMKMAVDSYAQQLQKKIPTQMGPNQIAQQRLGQLNEVQKNINEQIRAATSDRSTEAYLRYETEQQKLEQAAKKESDTVDYRNANLQQRGQIAAARIQQMADNSKLLAGTRIEAATIAANSRIQSTEMLINGRLRQAKAMGLTGGTARIKVIQGNVKLRQQQIDAINTQVLQAQQLYNDSKASDHDKQAAQQYINQQEDLRKQFVDENNADFEQIKSLQSLGDDLNGTDTGSGSTDNSGSDIKIPDVINPNGARNTPPDSSKSKTEGDTGPVVKAVGPKDDSSNDQQYLKIIMDNLGKS